ncbi:helix-turn-helix domain-containing protein [Sphingomonas lacunae]|uniref:Helix-turn-helix domain-containing protein n=1 Tax=Sphingomonas lacunae TaxID=2698828 RepID=A0A6M4AV53_9SPHN|nr:helix-turn-helix domain-containing protein [Sphingomonas lacunae]QJQ32566.1 helix-turn-helix domain-containing protein [Sphingomonas lacunae]
MTRLIPNLPEKIESGNIADALFVASVRLTTAMLLSAAINLQSIADYSGIPRETVRRKLHILQDKGWITKDERNFMTVTDKAKANLNGLTESSLKYLVEMDTLLSRLD